MARPTLAEPLSTSFCAALEYRACYDEPSACTFFSVSSSFLALPPLRRLSVGLFQIQNSRPVIHSASQRRTSARLVIRKSSAPCRLRLNAKSTLPMDDTEEKESAVRWTT